MTAAYNDYCRIVSAELHATMEGGT
jgi:hypothetical protein